MPGGRKNPNKLHEIEECFENIKAIEMDITQDSFLVIDNLKESLQSIKSKWKILNRNYKTVLEDKTKYQTDMETSIRKISELEEGIKNLVENHSNELRIVENKSKEDKDFFQSEIEKKQIENLESKKKIEDVTEYLKSVENKNKEKEIWLMEMEQKNSELIMKVEELSCLDMHLDLVKSQLVTIEEQNRKLNEEIERVKEEREQTVSGLRNQIEILVNEKTKIEKSLEEMKVMKDKKSKCCIL